MWSLFTQTNDFFSQQWKKCNCQVIWMISLYFNFDSQIEISMLNGEKLYLLGGRNIQNLCAKKIQQSLVSWAVWNHTVGFWVVSWKLWDPLRWNQLLSQNRDLRPQVPQSSCAKDWKKKMIKFIYSEKATKFCEISTLLLTGTTQGKSSGLLRIYELYKN